MSHNETMLEKIRAVLEGRITADLEDYQIAGRSITKIPFETLVKYEGVYADRVADEKIEQDIADGISSNPRKIRVRFL